MRLSFTPPNQSAPASRRGRSPFNGSGNTKPAPRSTVAVPAVKFDEGVTTVKHVTQTQFMWASYDKDGKLTRAAGGDYTLKGEVYAETPAYGISSDFDEIKGKTHTFTCKVEGNKWYHNGKLSSELTIEEVWERVEKK